MPRKGIEVQDTLEPPITAVAYAGSGHRLRLSFGDGLTGEVDLEPQLRGAGPVFAPLRDPAYFAQVRLDEEAGTICWPHGADWAPEVLYRLVAAGPAQRQRVLAVVTGALEGIELDREADGRWIAEAPDMPGVLAYGASEAEALRSAVALALEVVAGRLRHGEL